eukprot:TRINITY_DN15160_c0_g1_i1.p1 TRINITY_DN15160_c0_g1~~TRINITY_DN15160_c0_g1_i1.p1  ORF type:complete len:217 (+),score=41.42 TRINITY_DN15160_c0_g1_i1:322-972(+)
MQFEEWYRNMPTITRGYMTGCIVTTLLVQLDVISPLELYLNMHTVIQKYEYWRLVTNFLFMGRFGLGFIFHMFFIVRHSRMLEENSFRGRTGDYFFLWLFGAVVLLIANWLLSFTTLSFRIMFLAQSLSFYVVYIFSRRNRDVRMSFLGLFTFTAPYLPWVILIFSLLLGQPLIEDLLGIAVGHIYYFLADVYPDVTGRRIMRTPGFIKSLFDDRA